MQIFVLYMPIKRVIFFTVVSLVSQCYEESFVCGAGAQYQQMISTEAELPDEDDRGQERQRKRKKSLADRVRKLSSSLGIHPSAKDSTVSLSGFFKSAEGETEEVQTLMDVMEEDEEEEMKIIGEA